MTFQADHPAVPASSVSRRDLGRLAMVKLVITAPKLKDDDCGATMKTIKFGPT